MNGTQRFFSWLLGPGVERESRAWMVECGHCNHTDNVWDLGGIRYKASGTKRSGGVCRKCGRFSMRRVYRSL